MHLEFRMSHLGGFHSKVATRFFFHGRMHFNFDMRIVRDDNLSILPTLPFNHACGLTLYCTCTEACFMFHQSKWKHIKWLSAELMNGKYLIESPGSFWTDWKLVFTRGGIQIVTPGAAYFGQNWLKVFHKTMTASGGPSNQHFT